MFDIDFPAEPTVLTGTVLKPEATDQRSGPMAKATFDNAEAPRARSDAEQTIREENDRLAHEFGRLKKLGLVVN